MAECCEQPSINMAPIWRSVLISLLISYCIEVSEGQGGVSRSSQPLRTRLGFNKPLDAEGANRQGPQTGMGGMGDSGGPMGMGSSNGLSALAALMSASPQVVALSGGTMMLNCSSPFPNGHVGWFRPMDGMQVSHDNDIISSERGRFVVRGDSRRGQFNLFIKNVKYPQDNGTWWCSIFNGPRIPTNMLVLVPPAERAPQISPISGIVFHVNSEAYTFSCVAHFAFPPVTLRWVKKSGPLMEYNPLPPTITIAPDLTMSAATNLILSPMNHGSVFSCEAEHPAFRGQVYSTDVQFIIADSTYEPDLTGGMKVPTRSRGPGDTGLGVVSAILLVALVILFFTLWLMRSHWQLDVRSRCEYRRIPCDEKSTMNGNAAHGHHSSDYKLVDKKMYRKFLLKVVVGGSLLLIIIVIFSYLIPLYLKGYTIPITGVDEIVTVLAGGLLWLDCSSLSQRSDDLMVVGWRKEYYKFYNQYNNPILGSNFGFPLNITAEAGERGARTQNHGMGRIAIYPALPYDQGLFICEVARIIDDQGHTKVNRRTYAVAVITEAPINTLLIGFVILGLLASVLLATLLVCHSIRRSPKTHNVDSENNTIEPQNSLPRSPSAPDPDAASEHNSDEEDDRSVHSDRKVAA